MMKAFEPLFNTLDELLSGWMVLLADGKSVSEAVVFMNR